MTFLIILGMVDSNQIYDSAGKWPMAKCAYFSSGAIRNLQIMDFSGPNLSF